MTNEKQYDKRFIHQHKKIEVDRPRQNKTIIKQQQIEDTLAVMKSATAARKGDKDGKDLMEEGKLLKYLTAVCTQKKANFDLRYIIDIIVAVSGLEGLKFIYSRKLQLESPANVTAR